MNLADELDRCVMCGMCSQHCPTYALSADENESPRGRIALISALTTGQLNADATLQAHLDHCTGCRACEAYCPSEVRFGAIMDAARTLLPQQTAASTPTTPSARWLRLYQRTGLQKLARGSGLLKPLGLAQKEGLLPSVIPDTPDWQDYYPADTSIGHRGDVALFTGCIANTFDRTALDASRRLLNALGYGVHVPATQGCCGAMALHSGQTDEAAALAQQNIHAFSGLEVQAIVHTASGCTARLSEYANTHDAEATAFAENVKDISQFLADIEWPAELRVDPLHKTVALHTPCSLQNVLRQAEAPRRLLQRIPQLEIVPLPKATRCCGGAGQYMLEQPDFSLQLREKTLTALDAINPQQKIDTLVTSNLGCALQIAAGLRESGQTIAVTHPVVLLTRQIKG